MSHLWRLIWYMIIDKKILEHLHLPDRDIRILLEEKHYIKVVKES